MHSSGSSPPHAPPTGDHGPMTPTTVRLGATARAALTVALAAGALAACSSRECTLALEAQTDPAPVLARTTGLPEDAEYLWWSGTLGSGRAPGPSTSFVDASVTADEATAERWRAACGQPQSSGMGLGVVPELAETLPEDLVPCPGLAEELAVEGWEPRVWVSPTEPVLVLHLAERDG